MSKKEEKKDKEQKDKKNEDKKKAQIKLRVFEEDDYFEEFEEGNNKIFFIILFYNIDKLQLEKIKSEEMRRWQANWEDEEINDNFENVLKQELTAHGQKLPS